MRIGGLGAAAIAPTALIHPARVRGGAILQAVAARDPARADAFAKQFGFARVAEDYTALVNAPDVDLVYNALPINLHAAWSIRALEAGKHVLCEKPFAMNVVEAQAVIDAARASGKRVIEAFHYRYHPGFLTLLAWLDSGDIGPVTDISATFNIGIPDQGGAQIRHLPETGGGAFMDLGCYPLSWTLSVMGAAPTRVDATATLTARGVDESLRASLEFEGGAKAELSASMALGEAFSADLRIIGTRGQISFINPLAPHGGARLTLDAGGETRTASISRISTYTYQLEAVLAALQTGEELPTEGHAILRQQQSLDQIYAAAGLRHLRFPTEI